MGADRGVMTFLSFSGGYDAAIIRERAVPDAAVEIEDFTKSVRVERTHNTKNSAVRVIERSSAVSGTNAGKHVVGMSDDSIHCHIQCIRTQGKALSWARA